MLCFCTSYGVTAVAFISCKRLTSRWWKRKRQQQQQKKDIDFILLFLRSSILFFSIHLFRSFVFSFEFIANFFPLSLSLCFYNSSSLSSSFFLLFPFASSLARSRRYVKQKPAFYLTFCGPFPSPRERELSSEERLQRDAPKRAQRQAWLSGDIFVETPPPPRQTRLARRQKNDLGRVGLSQLPRLEIHLRKWEKKKRKGNERKEKREGKQKEKGKKWTIMKKEEDKDGRQRNQKEEATKSHSNKQQTTKKKGRNSRRIPTKTKRERRERRDDTSIRTPFPISFATAEPPIHFTSEQTKYEKSITAANESVNWFLSLSSGTSAN